MLSKRSRSKPKFRQSVLTLDIVASPEHDCYTSPLPLMACAHINRSKLQFVSLTLFRRLLLLKSIPAEHQFVIEEKVKIYAQACGPLTLLCSSIPEP